MFRFSMWNNNNKIELKEKTIITFRCLSTTWYPIFMMLRWRIRRSFSVGSLIFPMKMRSIKLKLYSIMHDELMMEYIQFLLVLMYLPKEFNKNKKYLKKHIWMTRLKFLSLVFDSRMFSMNNFNWFLRLKIKQMLVWQFYCHLLSSSDYSFWLYNLD
jgi:hypothetical protein